MVTDVSTKRDRLSLRQTVELKSTQLTKQPPLPRKNSEKLISRRVNLTKNTNLIGSQA